MAESWVRLWADMTTDPKWQTIARKSGQPRCLVIALFSHLLLLANYSEIERGHLDKLNVEDVASALDVDEEQITAILDAMQGRVIEDNRLSGWSNRQPAREDMGNPQTGAKSAAQRKREQRAREKENQSQADDSSQDVTQCHEESRSVTQCHAPEAEAEADISATTTGACAHEQSPPDDQTKITKPAADLSIALRRVGVNANSGHPTILGFVKAGVTVDQVLEAADIAKQRKPSGNIGVNYLRPIIEDILNPPAPATMRTGSARGSPSIDNSAAARVRRANGLDQRRPGAGGAQ